jgi:hypothetical protein
VCILETDSMWESDRQEYARAYRGGMLARDRQLLHAGSAAPGAKNGSENVHVYQVTAIIGLPAAKSAFFSSRLARDRQLLHKNRLTTYMKAYFIEG